MCWASGWVWLRVTKYVLLWECLSVTKKACGMGIVERLVIGNGPLEPIVGLYCE